MSSDTLTNEGVAALIGIVPFNPVAINRNGRTSTVKAREKQSQKLLSKTITCLEVKSMLESSPFSTMSYNFSTCCRCGSFVLEHLMVSKLRLLKDNNPLKTDINLPRIFRCQTHWHRRQCNTDAPIATSATVTPSACLSSPPSSPSNPSILSRRHSMASPLQENPPFQTTKNNSTCSPSIVNSQGNETSCNEEEAFNKRTKRKKKKDSPPPSLPETTNGLQELRKRKILQKCDVALEEREKALEEREKALDKCNKL